MRDIAMQKIASGRLYRFGLVGTVGFIVDAAAFTALQVWLQAPHTARLGAFLIAVSATFSLNKRFTFHGRTKSRPLVYFLGQLLSLGVNMAVFSAVIWHAVWLPGQYYLGLALGSIAAMYFNYQLSHRYAFL
jgi:putative flippase GtrA